jgi:hypothetical protein
VSEDKTKVDLNVVQVVASALAAVSSAVLLSTVGVAGTVIGAAVGSVIATVGSAVYTYSLRASRDRVAAAAQVAAMARANLVRRAEAAPLETQQLTSEDGAVQEEPARAGSARPGWREALTSLNWRRVAALAAAVFLAAMVAIVAFELVAGKPVSVYTGGTSKASHSRTTVGGSAQRAKDPSPSPSATSSDSASQEPSTGGSLAASPSGTPGETPSGTPVETPSASATETTSPTDLPDQGATPTAAPGTGTPPPAG